MVQNSLSRKDIFKQHWFWLMMAIVIFLINQLPFLTDMRPVMYDEAWYANTAYHFSQGDGFLNSVVGSGGNANFLLPLLTGSMFGVFGYSLFTIRLTSVLCGVLTLLFLHLCMKEIKSSIRAEIAVLGFFVSIALYNTIFRFGRPECASIMCMTGGIWFLLRYMRKNSWGNIIGLSVFTFLSAVGHPYALLFFAVAGCMLLFQIIKSHAWIDLAHLSVLLLSAVLVIFAMGYISYRYDIAKGPAMLSRFSMGNIVRALPEYIKEFCMSKTTLYMVVLLPVIAWCCWRRESRVRELAISIVVSMILFPFMFSTDMMMIGLGADYVAIVGTLLIAPCVDYLRECRYNLVFGWIFAVYCMANLGLGYYYNYGVKYEKCNSVLECELRAIIPQDAVVYTPLRQYPFVMQNKCYSDHYRGDLPNSFDYLIMNSQDKDIYSNSQLVCGSLDDYTIIYERSTKQYGDIKVYRSKLLNE